MTRRKWTTDEQEAWLEQQKAAFLEANQKKTAAKDFFPIITKEFREKWLVLPVMPQEINDAGGVELATRVKQGKYDKVHIYHS
jgi:predicted metal-dependent hydrolase